VDARDERGHDGGARCGPSIQGVLVFRKDLFSKFEGGHAGGGESGIAKPVECDPSFRMAERFSSSTACQGSPCGRPSKAARFARPGQAVEDENNGLHANDGSTAKVASEGSEVDVMRMIAHVNIHPIERRRILVRGSKEAGPKIPALLPQGANELRATKSSNVYRMPAI
jgi:hypothetical protein